MGIYQPLDAAFRYVGQFGHGHSKEIESQTHRLSVEITTKQEILLFSENQRIVSGRVHFDLYDFAYIVNGVFGGTVHLW